MAGDELAALGRELRGRADEWLAGLLDGWALPGAEAAAEPLAELVRLERDAVALAGQVATLETLRSTLTAGFPGMPAPVLAEAPTDEDADDERDGRRGAGAPAFAPSASQQARSSADDRASRDRGESPSTSHRPTEPSSGFDRPSVGRDTDRASVPTSSGTGIRGLGDLASLAGSGGLELGNEEREGSRQDDPDRGWDGAPTPASHPERMGRDDRRENPDRPSAPVDHARYDSPRTERSAPGADAMSLAPQPIRLPTWELPGGDAAPDQSRQRDATLRPTDEASASGTRAQDDLPRVDGSAPRANAPSAAPQPIRLPPRTRRDVEGAQDAMLRPDTDPSFEPRSESGDRSKSEAERWSLSPSSVASVVRDGRLTLGLLEPGRIVLPFLDQPEALVEGADVGDNDSADRGAAGFPAASREAEQGWPVGDAREIGGDDAGSQSLPSMGRRIRPAAEILSALSESARSVDAAPRPEGSAGWPAQEPPSPQPLARKSGNPEALAHAAEAKVAIVREVETRSPLPEPPGWPDLDVQDLMDALAREIMHEYRRHYGGA